MLGFVIALSMVAVLGLACADENDSQATGSSDLTKDSGGKQGGGAGGSSETESGTEAASKPKKVDPRKGGFEITLGEWAVTPEAPAIRPGKVTFVIRNQGTMDHGYEVELEGDSSGSGSGDIFKAESELIGPGETTRMTVVLPNEGVYKIECLVDGHDDMGMEGPLEVRADAPLIKEKAASADGEIALSDFSFEPEVTEVSPGTEVTWRNDDPAPHTVTGTGDTFDSGTLDPKDEFSFVFKEPGTYAYRCEIHPEMKGTVKVR